MASRFQFRGRSGPVIGQLIDLEEAEMFLGRDLSSDIVVSDTEVSRTHARLYRIGEGYAIQDLKSTNGTWVNGHRVLAAASLAPGDEVTLGKVSVFVFELVAAPEADTTRGEPAAEELDGPLELTMAMPAHHRVTPPSAQPSEVSEGRSGAQVGERPQSGESEAGAGTDRQPETQPGPGKLFYLKYIAFMGRADLEGLLGLYHPDAILLGFETRAVGTDGLREYFGEALKGAGGLSLKPAEKFAESRDTLMAESWVETAHQVARIEDAFVLREGKVTHQFTTTVEVTLKSRTADA